MMTIWKKNSRYLIFLLPVATNISFKTISILLPPDQQHT